MQFLSSLFVLFDLAKKKKKKGIECVCVYYLSAIRVDLTTNFLLFSLIILFYWSLKETLLYKINTQELWPHELLHIIYMQIYLFEYLEWFLMVL